MRISRRSRCTHVKHGMKSSGGFSKPIRRAKVSHNMPRYVLFLVSREWFEGFKENIGRVDVVQGVKARKVRPPLRPGDIMVLVVKGRREPRRSWGIVGELEVVELKKVGKEEYEELRKAGRVYEPPVPDFSGGSVYVKVVKALQIYPREVKLSELCDVKTRKSREPICRWILTGATVVDEQLVEGIRRKVEGGEDLKAKIRMLEERISRIEGVLGLKSFESPLTHECIELMLLELGRSLGFKTYTADPSKRCGDVELRTLADLPQENLPFVEKLKDVDVIWYAHNTYRLFEVVLTTDMGSALIKFAEATALNAEYFIVSRDEGSFRRTIALNPFSQIRRKTHFISIDELLRTYYITKLWRSGIDIFKLPFLST